MNLDHLTDKELDSEIATAEAVANRRSLKRSVRNQAKKVYELGMQERWKRQAAKQA